MVNKHSETEENDPLNNVLSLENEFHNEGYQEGLAAGQVAGTLEGKQFGIQTGFQRHLSLGVLQGRLQVWNDLLTQNPQLATEKLVRNLNQLQGFLKDIPTSNSDDDILEFEKRLKKSKIKARIISSHLQDILPIDIYDDSVHLISTEENIEDIL